MGWKQVALIVWYRILLVGEFFTEGGCSVGASEGGGVKRLVCIAMGRSRRERVVALTQTRKHIVGRESKQVILENIRSKVDAYRHIYVLSTENMRNSKLKGLRADWKDSHFFFGRKRIIQVAFGRTAEEEYAEGLMKVSEQLRGEVGVLFTNRSHESVVEFFSKYSEKEFARSGFVATERVHLNEGALEMFEAAQEANLRLLGLPVAVRKGVVTLVDEFSVCQRGERLTPERAKIMELLGMRMAAFRMHIVCHYDKSSGQIELMDENIDQSG